MTAESKVPKDVLDLVDQFMLLMNRPSTRDDEVLVLRLCVNEFETALAKGDSPNPALLTENLRWFKVRLDELGAGEVRA